MKPLFLAVLFLSATLLASQTAKNEDARIEDARIEEIGTSPVLAKFASGGRVRMELCPVGSNWLAAMTVWFASPTIRITMT